MQTTTNTIRDYLQEALDKRKAASIFRSLQVNEGLVDFCSNDSLSFARNKTVRQQVLAAEAGQSLLSGATGSRSISGNTALAEELEQWLAEFHGTEAGLLFNSGYDANIGLFSCIAKKEDTIVSDELIHASIIDGCRLSYANRYRFAHNDPADLQKKLHAARANQGESANIFVAVESVYSMDGDTAPLTEMVAICKKFNANLIVDEAHATGVFGQQGRGLVNQYGLEKEIFARVHTFGKALGCHGAVVVGPSVLRSYLINFARSFIFTTALPAHSLLTIRAAYLQLENREFSTAWLHKLVSEFRKDFNTPGDVYLTDSLSPIQSIIIPGNERVRKIAAGVQARGFDIRAIVNPSVPAGKERLRISLHMHNSLEQVQELKQSLQQILFS